MQKGKSEKIAIASQKVVQLRNRDPRGVFLTAQVNRMRVPDFGRWAGLCPGHAIVESRSGQTRM